MYSAKADGKGHSAFFEPSMHSAARRRLQLTGDLRRALSEGQLSVNYQPLIRLTDGKMLGVEALLRWNPPTMGLVAPADFIPLAEESGLIVSIGSFVLNEACRQLKIWQTEHADAPDYMSVNLSVRQFQREGAVVDEVRGALLPARVPDRHREDGPLVREQPGRRHRRLGSGALGGGARRGARHADH